MQLDADEVDTDVATAIGLVALGETTLPEAAEYADVTRWELEDAIEGAGLAGPLGLDGDCDLTAELDELFDERT